MDSIENFGDSRQSSFCVYCGGDISTREHAPSKVFLDDPYPENLPVIRACEKCNQSYSLDEEYTACLIECARVGGVDLDIVERPKIKQILSRKPLLAERLKRAVVRTEDGVSFAAELERLKRVFVKLAQGHALFEENEPQREEPARFSFGTLEMMTEQERENFEKTPELYKAPEVGSRAMQRILISNGRGWANWVEVQRNRYRYLTTQNGARIVLSEYVWCDIGWD